MLKKITMADPFFSERDQKIILKETRKILKKSLSMGPNVIEFENSFKKKFKSKYAVAMNSCTSTLEAALKYVKENNINKEVILSLQTFIANATAVYNNNLKPVFSEISEKNLCLDFNNLKKKITNKTAAVIIVNMF